MSGTTSSGSSEALYMGAARRQQPVRNQDSTSGHLAVPTSVSRPGPSQSGSPATYRSTGQSDTSSLNPRERELLAAGGIVPDRAAVNGVDPNAVNRRLEEFTAQDRNSSNSSRMSYSIPSQQGTTGQSSPAQHQCHSCLTKCGCCK